MIDVQTLDRLKAMRLSGMAEYFENLAAVAGGRTPTGPEMVKMAVDWEYERRRNSKLQRLRRHERISCPKASIDMNSADEEVANAFATRLGKQRERPVASCAQRSAPGVVKDLLVVHSVCLAPTDGRSAGKGKEEVGYLRKQALDRDRCTAACAGRKTISRASRS